MSDEIVRRLRNTVSPLKSLLEGTLREAEGDEDEEDIDYYPGPDDGSEDESPVEDDTSPADGEEKFSVSRGATIGGPSSGSAPSGGDTDDATSDEELGGPDIDSLNDNPDNSDVNVNPLDNNYAVNYKLGDRVTLSYSNGTSTDVEATIDGYDPEGFYRIKLASGLTINGLTDLALSDLVTAVQESTCVCGGTKFITENSKLICDKCGRRITESTTDNLTKLDKSRPKGKRLIRSEAHPVSTTAKPDISISESATDSGYAVLYTYDGDDLSDYQTTAIVRASSEEDAISKARTQFPDGYRFRIDTTIGERGYIPSISVWKEKYPQSNYTILESKNSSVKESIRRAFKKSTINESVEEGLGEFSSLKSLEGEFWTRLPELVADIEELGYDVLEANSERVVVTLLDSDEDDELIIPMGGTARTMKLDFDRATIA